MNLQISGYGVISSPSARVFDRPEKTTRNNLGIVSTIADELPYGAPFAILDRADDWVHIRSFYGYEGYLPRSEYLPLRDPEGYCSSHLAVISKATVDVLTSPQVQGDRMLTLPREALVLVDKIASEGWVSLKLLDGRTGYVPQAHLDTLRFPLRLDKTDFSASFSFSHLLSKWYNGDEATFRQALVTTARTWLGTQYTWGGRCGFGLDCSGLVSLVYQRCGVLIYRDAKLRQEYPLEAIPFSTQDSPRTDRPPMNLDVLQVGDALYFPGHIALYLGDGLYLHSTGRAGDCGVVINSLHPDDPLFRRDLFESLYAAGGLRLPKDDV